MVGARKTRGRTGCRTCRIRRIKCDEDRPSCRRCTSTGRKCDGYELASPTAHAAAMKQETKRPLQPAPQRPKCLSTSLRLSEIEAQGFTFFQQHSAHEIPGCFGSAIWDQLVFQLSHSEPCIMHALVAVGSLHSFTQGHCPSLHTSHYLVAGSPFAIRQYVKSLYHLRQRLDGPKDPACEQVTLVACLLFICLEMLQGNRAGALAHLQTGLRILSNSNATSLRIKRRQNNITFEFVPWERDSMSNQLAVIFARLDYESTMFGQQSPMLTFVPVTNEMSAELQLPESFSTLEEARQSLDTLANAVLTLRGTVLHLVDQALEKENATIDWVHRVCMHHAHARTIDLSHHQSTSQQHAMLLNILQRWNVSFKALATNPQYSDSQPAILLELQHFYLFFLVSTLRNTHEVLCDDFNEIFKRVVRLADIFINGISEDPSRRTSTFTLESGIIPSLYLVAMKCRDFLVRRKAISLLKQTPCQEGMWEGGLIARFAAEMAKLEEGASGICEKRQPDTASGVPERARFCDVVIALSDKMGYGRLVCARYLHESTEELEVSEISFAL